MHQVELVRIEVKLALVKAHDHPLGAVEVPQVLLHEQDFVLVIPERCRDGR
jgi:hypothetical protein